jgi:hypothetical protein
VSRKKSNEWEFQGQVLNWLNDEISRRRMGLDRATQETSRITPKRSDLIVWRNRASEDAFSEMLMKKLDGGVHRISPYGI